MIRNGSCPDTTASGKGASGGSWEMSSPQAKKRRKGRRFWLAWSRMVPRKTGKRASSAVIRVRCVIGFGTSSVTSPSSFAKVRKCAGRTTLIMAVSVPPRKVRRADFGQWKTSCPQRRGRHRLDLRWCRNTHRKDQGHQQT